jgi:prephenate dehydrogenase
MKKNGSKRRAAQRRSIGRLAIFGVGLIGGSLALALKREQAVGRIVGVGRSRANLLVARRLGIIDEIATDAAAAVKNADLVLIAVPLGQTAAVLAQIAPHLEAHTIVTDAGSTKRDVIAHARRYLAQAFARFVPAHPIAGTEKSGAGAASARLFDGHNLIVTPEPETDPRAIKTVTAMWKLAGMRVIAMPAADHDHVFALVSHLPHVLSFALVDQIAGRADAATLFKHTGGGFRDTTRIAGSSPEMWRDVCLANRDALLAALDDYLGELERLRGMLEASDGQGLEQRFTAARDARTRWIKPQ